MNKKELRQLLDAKAEAFNRPDFIEDDPISVPHRFSRKQDIEIAALFAALLAWGNRTSIINSTNRLMQFMDEAPADFIINHHEQDRKRMQGWVHRTFQFPDLLYFLEFLQFHYRHHESLEIAFTSGIKASDTHIENGLIHFHRYFFSLPHLKRTEKHLQTPERKSACKRINLFLRWMVRTDSHGVDFGLWKQIGMNQLLCPLDVHVQRAALALGLLQREKSDWKACLELSEALRKLDPNDPVRYDFALFGISLEMSEKS
jgi:uncharacterized protein (TIGR02757 family)